MKRILVIDDDEMVNDMLVQLLTEAGYEVEAARDGSCGMKLLAAKPFDLIITDIVMPEREGLETILAIRETDRTIPIIAISGAGPEQYLQMARQFGADHTFKKPIDIDRLLGAVQECFSKT